jgi:hypothetical protein
MDITFENLPKAIKQIHNELLLLRQLLSVNVSETVNNEYETLNVVETANILRLHPTTVSQKLKRGELPGQKKGKKWFVFKKDLFDYLRQSECKSYVELVIEADEFLSKKKK